MQGEKTRAEIAREHDIAKSLLYKWEQAFLAKGAEIFSSTDQFQKELARRDEYVADLEQIVGQLTKVCKNSQATIREFDGLGHQCNNDLSEVRGI